MKIRIFGDIASGKSTLANKLGKEFKIPVFSTDDFMYKIKYTKKRSEFERKKIASKIIKKNNWIIEGTHHSDWIGDAAKRADLIIVFNVSLFTLIFRIIKRTIFEEKSKQKFRDMFRLIKMLLKYSKEDNIAYRKIALTKKHLISDTILVNDVKKVLNKK